MLCSVTSRAVDLTQLYFPRTGEADELAGEGFGASRLLVSQQLHRAGQCFDLKLSITQERKGRWVIKMLK